MYEYINKNVNATEKITLHNSSTFFIESFNFGSIDRIFSV